MKLTEKTRIAAHLWQCLQITILLFTSFLASGQNFQNMDLTCGSPIVFQDPGGASNYGANCYYVYTICPQTAGQYASINFSSINLGNNDNIAVINGTNSHDPFLKTFKGDHLNTAITSSSDDGCLTLVFSSDANNHGAGWNATVNCTSVAGNNINICEETDCVGGCARTICSSGTYSWQNDGGDMNDLNNLNAGCLSAYSPYLERNHVWYYINPSEPGNLDILITSDATGNVYDYALWKSYNNEIRCPSLSGDAPISCEAENNGVGVNYPQGTGFTDAIWPYSGQPYSNYAGFEPGVSVTQTDIDNGVVFMLLINVRSFGNPQPEVSINIEFGDGLSCLALASELEEFSGEAKSESNDLFWKTITETGVDHFIIESSKDGKTWKKVGDAQGSDYSSEPIEYALVDPAPFYPLTYYKLKQYNENGEVIELKTIQVMRSNGENWLSDPIPNPSDEKFTIFYHGNDLNSPVSIDCISSTGEIVLSDDVHFDHGNKQVSFTTETISPGLYFLKCTQDERQKVFKLVIK